MQFLEIFRALFRRGYWIVRYSFCSRWLSTRRSKAVDRDSKPNQETSALLQRCGVAQPVRAPGWRNGEIWDQNWALFEPSGEFRPVPQISSTAHASREAGRCSVGLPHTVAAARGARKKGTKQPSDSKTRCYRLNSKLSNIHVGKLPKISTLQPTHHRLNSVRVTRKILQVVVRTAFDDLEPRLRCQLGQGLAVAQRDDGVLVAVQ
jgi:hypothetical protein